MQIHINSPASPGTLEDLVKQMLPMNLTNVVTLRPEHKLVSMSPEEAFIAWTMGLPAEADVASEARAAIVELQALKYRYRHPAVRRLERYLREALIGMPAGRRPRRGPVGRRGRRDNA